MSEIQQVLGRKASRFPVFGKDTGHTSGVLVHVVGDPGHAQAREFVELSNRADGAVRLPSLEFLQVESAF